jgi:ribosomal protein S3
MHTWKGVVGMQVWITNGEVLGETRARRKGIWVLKEDRGGALKRE